MVQEGLISLRIYDTMGRLVRKLVEGDRRQGKYSIYWNGKDDKGNDVGEGIFFCQLKSGGNSLSKKLIRIK
jgi:flagellar hook assembly protein FlgD